MGRRAAAKHNIDIWYAGRPASAGANVGFRSLCDRRWPARSGSSTTSPKAVSRAPP